LGYGWMQRRMLAAMANPWKLLSERYVNASLLLEKYLWSLDLEDDIYPDLQNLYDEVCHYRSYLFKMQPRCFTAHLSRMNNLWRMQAAILDLEERVAACAANCSQILVSRRRSPYLPENTDVDGH